MVHRLAAGSFKATALVLVLGASAQVAANMYRYTDDNGQIAISGTIPREATKRGYDILNDNGRVVETIPPAPTEDEIAARKAEKHRQKALAEQIEKDRLLLKRFSHPDQAVKAMHRKIRELEGLIQLKRGNISVISNQLDNEQSRAANMERAGREIPEATLEKLRRLEAQIGDIEREIASQAQEIEELRKAFEADIRRLEEVTGEARTLPLDPTETEN
ncbi:MAG: DUF4124 domain-containing protein [Pseudomonadota bacterium]|nr:DUF4124 domain-containing protein [Pseudomonadota bacterium]